MKPLTENFEHATFRRSGFARQGWGTQDKLAVDAYTRNGGQSINGALRGDPMYPMDQTAQRQVQALDSAISKSELKQPLLVYRGTRHTQEFKVGSVIQESGFTSTSMSSFTAGSFGPNLVEVELPAGTHAVPGRDIEAEVLLGRGSRFQVVSNDGKTVRLRAL